MPRAHRNKWVWSDERLLALAGAVNADTTCTVLANRFTELYEEECPGLLLTKDTIYKVFRNKSTREALTRLVGSQRLQVLTEMICRPRGRPKGARDKKPRTMTKPRMHPRRTRPVIPANKSAVGTFGYSRPRD